MEILFRNKATILIKTMEVKRSDPNNEEYTMFSSSFCENLKYPVSVPYVRIISKKET